MGISLCMYSMYEKNFGCIFQHYRNTVWTISQIQGERFVLSTRIVFPLSKAREQKQRLYSLVTSGYLKTMSFSEKTAYLEVCFADSKLGLMIDLKNPNLVLKKLAIKNTVPDCSALNHYELCLQCVRGIKNFPNIPRRHKRQF